MIWVKPIDFTSQYKQIKGMQQQSFGEVIVTPFINLLNKIIYGKVKSYYIFNNDERIGFLQTWGRFNNVHISYLLILPQYQGRYYGSRVIGNLVRKYGKDKTISLHTRKSNTRMHKICKGYNFTKVRKIWRYYGDEDGIYYKRDKLGD